MKDIKFRVWDKATNSMITNDDDANGDVKIYLNGAVSIDGVWATKDVDLMQYTGLKDENGVEIYEGDIFLDDEGYASKVEWNNKTSTYVLVDCESLTECCEFADLYIDKCEVIGNIYQNPELLEGE